MKAPSIFRIFVTAIAVTSAPVFSTDVCFGQFAAAAAAPATASRNVSVATLERFKQALELSKLAANHDMHALSFRAVRESLGGGPPVTAIKIQSGTSFSIPNASQNPQYQQTIPQVQKSLFELNEIWKTRKFPPQRVYETLAQVVLPLSRPAELFLYAGKFNATSTGTGGTTTGSGTVSRLLVEWAKRANRLEDLERRILKRREQPRAALAADILLTELALSGGDVKRANQQLAALQKRLMSNSLQTTAELVLHVAVPALKNPQTAEAAIPLVERAAENLSQSDVNSAGNLLLNIARVRFKPNDAPAAVKHLHKYLEMHQVQNSRHSGDYGLYLRRQQLNSAAAEMLRSGQLKEGLKLLGEYTDISTTRYSSRTQFSGSLGAALVRHLSKLPAEERYQLLKEWSFPKPGRQTIRIFAAQVSELRPPAVFAKAVGEQPSDSAFDLPLSGLVPCVADTAHLLIEAARETGSLDQLAGEVERLAAKKVENADALAMLIEIARGNSEELLPRIVKLGEKLRKNNQSQPRNSRAAVPWADYLVVRACLNDDKLRRQGNAAIRLLTAFGRKSYNHSLIQYTLRDQVSSLAIWNKRSFADQVFDPGLMLWEPASHFTAAQHAAGAVRSCWVAHEGHISRQTGPENSFLFFSYPLLGSFDFSFDAWHAGWQEGHGSYGGIAYEPYAYNKSGTIF